MNNVIELRDIEPIRVAYMRYRGLVSEANKVFPNVYKAVKGRVNGAPFFCYLELDPKTTIGEIELCVPTAEVPCRTGIGIKEMPGIKAVCVSHAGSYNTLDQAYTVINQYASEKGILLQPPFREVYIKGPGLFFKGNPDKYLTEVLFPIKED